MIESLRIRGYRAFEHFELNDLAHVNLLVGKNGCGKTSVLEAVEYLAAGGTIDSIAEIASRRGETDFFQSAHDQLGERSFPNVSHLFHGHTIAQDVDFKIDVRRNTEDEKIQTGCIARICSPDDKGDKWRAFVPNAPRFVLETLGSSCPVSEDGSLRLDLFTPPQPPPSDFTWTRPVHLVTSDLLGPQFLSNMWDRVIIESQEQEVYDAMKVLDPEFEKLFFLRGDPRRVGYDAIWASYSDARNRMPIGTAGEGIRRFLALSLSLVQAKRGILLVDEIDTGLHYTVLSDMWRLVVEAARKSDVQVFATTHSLDCVKALAWLCRSYPELGHEVALHKIHSGLEESVVFDAENIIISAEQGIEMR